MDEFQNSKDLVSSPAVHGRRRILSVQSSDENEEDEVYRHSGASAGGGGS